MQRLGVQGVELDRAKVRNWYERAKELGATEADGKLARLSGDWHSDVVRSLAPAMLTNARARRSLNWRMSNRTSIVPQLDAIAFFIAKHEGVRAP